MSDPVTIRRVPTMGLAKGLRLKLSPLHRIDEHLYSFCISHPSAKYLEIGVALSWSRRKKNFLEIHLIDTGGKDFDDVTCEDYRKGVAKGAVLNVNFGREVTAVLTQHVVMKWETLFYLMIEYKGENIFATT